MLKAAAVLSRLLWSWLIPFAACLMAGTAAADAPKTSTFPNTGQFTASVKEVKQGVAVMELRGDYSRDHADGSFNVEPRAVIAKEFYSKFEDKYDFLVVFSDFEFETGDARAFCNPTKNDIKGIGINLFDNTRHYGSAGRLQGFIDMAALSRYNLNPNDREFDDTLRVLAHEMLHRWGVATRFVDASGQINNSLLGKDGSHWSFLVDTGGSVEYGNRWKDNQDGSFTSLADQRFFSPLDLYLMGILKKEEVPPFFYIENPAIDPARSTEAGVTISGIRRDVSIEQIIAAEGVRVPDATQSQKQFRFGFILLTRPGSSVSDADVASVNAVRKAFETRLSALTGGRAIAQVFLEPKVLERSVLNDQAPPPVAIGAQAELTKAIAWLRQRQGQEGAWSDHPLTTVRDTTVVFKSLSDLSGQNASLSSASAWIASQPFSNTDYLSRRLENLRTSTPESDWARLLSSQNADGGWGIAPGYASNPLDSALAIQALAFDANAERKAASIARATQYLVGVQNTDGGWSAASSGTSRTAATTMVLAALAPHGFKPNLDRASDFLAGRQNPDGGFGDSPSTVHDTANVVLSLAQAGQLGAVRTLDAFAFLNATQGANGSWQDSVYATALAIKALGNAQAYNWVAQAIQAQPDAVRDGQRLALRIRITNAGTIAAPATTVDVYTGDPKQGAASVMTLTVPPLDASQSVLLNGSWRTLEKTGNHLLHAVVDPAGTGTEVTRLDNTATVRVTVAPAPAMADLSISTDDILLMPSAVDRLPATITVLAQVANLGHADTQAVTVRLWQGRDAASAVVVDETTINVLGRSSVPVSLTARMADPGQPWIAVELDPAKAIADTDRTNNKADTLVRITPSVDLSVTPGDLVVPGSVLVGSDQVLKAVIRNRGTTDTPPFDAVLTVSNDSASRQLLRTTLQLAPNGERALSLPWRVDLDGRLEFKVQLDPAATVVDIDRSNNVATVVMTASSAQGPNLAVGHEDFQIEPVPVLEGRDFTVRAKIRNTGNSVSPAVQVGFYEGDPSAAGQLIAPLQTLAGLAPGASGDVTAVVPALSGTADRLYFVAIDPGHQLSEVSRDDNVAFKVATVIGLPDLAVSSAGMSFEPAAPKPGDPVALVVNVQNLGAQATGPFSIKVLDAVSRAVVVEREITAGISPRASSSIRIELAPSEQPTARSLIVVVDPDDRIHEHDESNNQAEASVSVQSGTAFVSELYFSPNGDGIKDTTTFGFRAPQAQVVTVTNQDGGIVRRFSLQGSAQDRAVVWDGLTDAGRLSADGVYVFKALLSDGQVSAQASVTLDNNRRPILSVSDPAMEYYRNLTCQIGNYVDHAYSGDEENAFFILPPGGTSSVGVGIGKLSLNGADASLIVGPSIYSGADYVELSLVSSSTRGETVAFVRSAHSGSGSSWTRSDEVWVVAADGTGLRRIGAEVSNSDTSATIRHLAVSDDGSYVVINVNHSAQSNEVHSVIRRIPVDGSSAGAVILDTRSLSMGEAVNLLFSPDRRKAIASVVVGQEYWVQEPLLLDLAGGNVRRFPQDLYGTNTPSYIWFNWSPDSAHVAMYGWDRFLGGAPDNRIDAVFDVFDVNYALVKRVKTNRARKSSTGNIIGVDWSSAADEFMFIHRSGGDDVRLAMSAADADDEMAILAFKASIQTGQLTQLAPQYASVDDDGKAILEPLNLSRWGDPFWAPHDRTVLASTFSFESGWAALGMDNQPARELFRGWLETITPNSGSSEIAPLGFSRSGRRLFFASSRDAQDRTSACYEQGSSHIFSYESLENLVADLLPVRDARVGGILLKGTASDLNLAGYTLEYANAQNKNQWHPIGVARQEPRIGETLATWVPPSYGSFFVRLTVWDKAGNTRQVVRRVSWNDTPAITDLVQNLEYVSPNGDGVQDTLSLSYRVLEPVHLAFEVRDAAGVRVRLIERDHAAIGTKAVFEWDGRDDLGRLVPDGKYVLKVLDYEFRFTVDNTPPKLVLSYPVHAFGISADRGIELGAAFKGTVEDIHLTQVMVERGDGVAPAAWVTEQADLPITFDQPSKLYKSKVEAYVSDQDFAFRRLRLSAVDKAGNRASYTTALGAQDLYLARGRAEFQGTPLDNASNGAPMLDVIVDGSYSRTIEQAVVAYKVFNFPIKPEDFIKENGPMVALHLAYHDSSASVLKRRELHYAFVPGKVQNVPAVDQLHTLQWRKVPLTGLVQGESQPGISELEEADRSVNFRWQMPETAEDGTWLISVLGLDDLGNQWLSSVHKVMHLAPPPRLIPKDVLQWTAHHVPSATCGIDPPEKLNFELYAQKEAPTDLYPVLLSAVLSHVKADGSLEEVARGDADQGIWRSSFATADWPVGAQRLRVKAFVAMNSVTSSWIDLKDDAVIYVEHTPPKVAISAPVSGQKLCASHLRTQQGEQVTYVPVSMSVDAAFATYDDIQLQMGLASDWSVQEPIGYGTTVAGIDATQAQSRRPSRFCSLVGDDRSHCRDSGPVQWARDPAMHRPGEPPRSLAKLIGATTEGVRPLHGELSLRARAYGVSGHLTCSAPVSIEVDGRADVRSGLNRSLFSPNGDDVLDDVTVSVSVLEAVKVSVTAHKVRADSQGNPGTVEDEVLARLVDGVDVDNGTRAFVWNGSGTSGSTLPDGLYALKVVSTDGCGNESVEWLHVEIDVTPPAVSVTSPSGNSTVDLEVLVKGSVSDKNLQNYKAAFALDAQPDQWLSLSLLSNAAKPVTDGTIARWNTLGVQAGTARILVSARDLAGNVTEVFVPVTIQPMGELITSLAVSPDAVSPNGDGQRDQAAIQFNVTQAVRATLELQKPNGDRIRVLMNAVDVPAGQSIAVWDGRRDQGSLADDGDIVAVLKVETLGSTAITQEAKARFVLDNTPPVVQFEPAPRAFTAAAEPIVAILNDATAMQASFSASVAGAAWTELATGEGMAVRLVAPMAQFPEGPVEFKVVATDSAGNRREEGFKVEIDRTPPKVVLSSPSTAAHLSGREGKTPLLGLIEEKNLVRHAMTLSPGDAPGQGAAVELFNATQKPTMPELFQLDVAALADGPHVLMLVAEDAAGQTAEASTVIHVDNTPPVAVIRHSDTPRHVRTGATVMGTASDVNLADFRIELAPGNPSQAQRFSEIARGTQAVADAALATLNVLPSDGTYTLRLTVTDKAGNTAVSTQEIVVDNTAPLAVADLKGRIENRRDAALQWTAVAGTDIAGYVLTRNGQRIEAMVTGTTHSEVGLPAGTYTYVVRAVDRAGNESEPSNAITLVVSLTDPVAQIFSPARGAYVGSVIDIRGNASAPADFKEYRLFVGSGAAPQAWTLLRRSSVPVTADLLASWDTLALMEGSTHALKLESEDLSGQIATETITVIVNNQPPAAPTLHSANGLGNRVGLVWSANTEADLQGYLVWRNDKIANAKGLVIGSVTPYLVSQPSHEDLDVPDGKHRYSIQAVDKAGNMSDPSNVLEVLVDTRAPQVTLVRPGSGAKVDKTVTLVGQSPDTDIATVKFQYRLDDQWVDIGQPKSVEPWTIEWSTTSLPFGVYTVRAVATDLGGRTDPSPAELQIELTDLQPPEKVSGLTALARGGDVLLSWTPSNSSNVAGYYIERTDAFGDVIRINDELLTDTQHVDRDLDDGTHAYHVIPVSKTNVTGQASDRASALVFSAELEQPYTPTVQEASGLAGKLRPGYQAEVRLVNGQVVATAAVDANGAFVVPASIPLSMGDNRFELVGRDAAGNESRAAPWHVVRGEAPQAPTGLVVTTTGDKEIDIQWQANAEPNIVGYSVAIDGERQLKGIQPMTAQASSERQHWASPNAFSADNAIDGNFSTGWSPDLWTPQDGQWLDVALHEPSQVQALTLSWAEGAAPSRIAVQGFDGEVWVPLSVVNLDGATLVTTEVRLPASYRTDRLRVVLIGNADHEIQLNEVHVRALDLTAENGLAIADLKDGRPLISLKAVNSLGLLSPESVQTATVGDVTPPPAPTLTAAVSGSTVSLDWSIPGTPDLDHFIVLRDGTPVATVSDAQLRHWTDGARPNGTYVYSLVAVDQAGNRSDPAEPVHVAVLVSVPAVLVDVTGTAPAAGASAVLHWLVDGAQPPAFLIERADQPGGTFRVVANGVTGSEFTDLGLQNGQTYVYVVTAQDEAGNRGASSSPVQVVPQDRLAPKAPVFTAPQLGGNKVFTRVASTWLAGMAEPGSTVWVKQNGTDLAQVKATPSSVTLNLGHGNEGWYDLSQDGELLFIGDSRSILRLSDGQTWLPAALSSSINTFHFDAAATGAAVVDFDARMGRLRLGRWNRTDDTLSVIDGFEPFLGDVSFMPDGRSVLAVGYQADGAGGLWLFEPGATQGVQLFDGDPWSYGSVPTAAPDASRIAYVRNGELMVLSVAERQERALSGLSDPRNPMWMADGSALLVDVQDAGGQRAVARVGLSDGQVVQLTPAGQDYTLVAVAPSGDAYLAVKERSLVRRAIHGQDELLLSDAVDTYAGVAARWGRGGFIAFSVEDEGLKRVEPAGSFRVPSVRLRNGENVFEAYAVDQAGNGSATGVPLSVTLLTDELPDWALTAENMLVLPSAPILGESVELAVMLRNQGATAPAASFALLVADASGTLSRIAQANVPSLAPSQTYTLRTRWTPTLAGAYTLTALVNGPTGVQEVSTDNNQVSRSVYVASSAKPVLQLSVGAPAYEQGATVSSYITLINPGVTFNGTVKAQVLDASGRLVQELDTRTVRDLGFGQTQGVSFTWGSGTTVVGTYRVKAYLLAANGDEVAAAEVPFDITRSGSADVATLRVVGSQAQYRVGDEVVLRGRVSNPNELSPLDGGQALLSLLDPTGRVVAERRVDISELMPASDALLELRWIADAQGAYRAVLSFSAASGGSPVPVETPVDVQPDDRVVVKGKLQVAGGAFAVDEQVIGSAWVSSTAEQASVPLRVRAVRITTGQTVALWEGSASNVSPAGQTSAVSLKASPLWPQGEFDLRLEAQVANVWQTLDHVQILVADRTPPRVGFVSPIADAVVASTSTSLVVNANAGMAPLASVEFSLDGKLWQSLPVNDPSAGLYGGNLLPASDGAVMLWARARDTTGNESTPVQMSLTIDNTAPAIVISGITDQQLVRDPVTPDVQVSDLHLATVQMKLNGVAYTAGAPIGEGSHTLIVSAWDKASNMSEKSVRFTVDTSAPVLVLLEPAAGSVQPSVPMVKVQASDTSSGVAKVELRVGEGAWLLMSDQGAGVHALQPPAMPEGVHGFAVRGVDKAGNTSVPLPFTITVDATAPTIEVTGVVDQQVSRVAVQAVVRIEDANLASSEVTLDGQPYVSGTPIGEGRHVLAASAVDKAGLTASQSITFTVDLTAPVLTVLAPSNEAVSKVLAMVQARATDGLSGMAAVEARLDGGAWTAMAANQDLYSLAFPAVADGVHTISVRASDAAGNTVAAPDVTVTVDTLPPIIMISGVSEGGTYAPGVAPLITVNDATPTTMVLTLDGQPFVSGQAVTTAGAHVLKVEVADKAGNTAQRTVSFLIGAAQLSGSVSVQPTSVPAGDPVSIDVRVTNGGTLPLSSAQVTLRIKDASSGAVVQTYTDTITLAVGASYQHAWSWTSQGTPGRVLDIALSVVADGQTRELGAAQLQIAPPKVAVDLLPTLREAKNILVYVRCARSEDDLWGACGRNSQLFSNPTSMLSCDNDRAAWLSQYLTSKGIPHAIVKDERAFITKLRSGLYSGYWISGGGLKLGLLAAGELAASVRRGDTLLVEGWTDGHHELIEALTGVDYKGKHTSTTSSMSTVSGGLYGASTLSISAPVKLQNIKGRVEATSSAGAAIVSSTFGQGRTLTFGFDLVATIRAGSAAATWSAIVGASDAYLDRPDPVDVVANGVVSLRAQLKNQGSQALTLDYTARLPAQASLIQANPAVTQQTVDAGLPTLRWRLNAQAGMEAVVDAAWRAPLTPGDYVLSTMLNQVSSGGQSTLLVSRQTNVKVLDAATLAVRAYGAVQSLDVGLVHALPKVATLKWLLLAKLAVQGQSWHTALRYLIAAQAALHCVDSAGSDDAKLAVARAIEAVERRL